MKELFQGRRFGFAPRAAIAYIAIGIGIALTLSDFMAWFAWGGSDTNGSDRQNSSASRGHGNLVKGALP